MKMIYDQHFTHDTPRCTAPQRAASHCLAQLYSCFAQRAMCVCVFRRTFFFSLTIFYFIVSNNTAIFFFYFSFNLLSAASEIRLASELVRILLIFERHLEQKRARNVAQRHSRTYIYVYIQSYTNIQYIYIHVYMNKQIKYL